MAVKSIIDIDLDDSKFKSFQALFDKYQAGLAKMPGAWAAVGKESNAVQKGFEAATAALLAQNDLAGKAAKEEHKAALASQRHARSWSDMARSSKSFAGNIKTATSELLKWASVLSGFSAITGVGGLWGIDRLAESVAATRRSSLGLGVSYGQQQAFNLNFGRFVDTNSLLGNVSGSLYDATSKGYVGLLAAGLSQKFLQSHNAADVSAELLQRLPHLFAGTPRQMIGAKLHGLGLDQVISQQDVVRYLNASPAERAAQSSRYRQDVGGLDVNSGTQRAWTDFTTQMSRAGTQIENTFVRGLVPLEKPLEQLSSSFEKFVATFLQSDALKKWIADLSTGIEGLAKYIGTPEFQKGVRDFVSGIGDMTTAISRFAKWLGGFNVDPTKPFGVDPENAIVSGTNAGENDWIRQQDIRRHARANAFLRRPHHAAASRFDQIGASDATVTEAYIRQQAATRGIDPDIAVRVARSEGLGGRYAGDDNSSFGVFQLHYGNVSNQPGMRGTGLGDAFTAKTGLDARDPKTWKAQVDYALDYASRNGWAPWHGWRGDPRAGIGAPPQAVQPPGQQGNTLMWQGGPARAMITIHNEAGANTNVTGDAIANGP